MKKAIVIFSGYNQRAVIAICRYLAMHNSRAFIIARDAQDPIYSTSYKKWVCCERSTLDLNVKDCLSFFSEIQKISGSKHLLFMPTSEFLNRFFLTNLGQFFDIEIPLVNIGLYAKVSDKNSFKEICSQFGLLVPELLPLADIAFPCVAKRRNYSMSIGKRVKPYLIFNQQDFELFTNNECVDEFYIEKYVEGNSYYLLYSFDKNGNYESYSQKNLIQQYDGKSIVAATKADINLTDISQKYAKLFQALGFYGLVMVEIRESNGQFYMIEANPRFWGPMQFIVDNIPKLLDLYFMDNGVQFSSKKATGNDYFWFGGYIANRANNQTVKFYDNNKMISKLDDISIAKWLQSDVYLRDDTLEYFYKELNEVQHEQKK